MLPCFDAKKEEADAGSAVEDEGEKKARGFRNSTVVGEFLRVNTSKALVPVV